MVSNRKQGETISTWQRRNPRKAPRLIPVSLEDPTVTGGVNQNARIARVLTILNLIQSRGRWNAKAIAAELHCSPRTVHRDLEVLEFAGVPWYFDEHEKCYRVRPDFRFPTLMLTDDEVLGQAIATALTKSPGLDVGGGGGSHHTEAGSLFKRESPTDSCRRQSPD